MDLPECPGRTQSRFPLEEADIYVIDPEKIVDVDMPAAIEGAPSQHPFLIIA